MKFHNKKLVRHRSRNHRHDHGSKETKVTSVIHLNVRLPSYSSNINSSIKPNKKHSSVRKKSPKSLIQCSPVSQHSHLILKKVSSPNDQRSDNQHRTEQHQTSSKTSSDWLRTSKVSSQNETITDELSNDRSITNEHQITAKKMKKKICIRRNVFILMVSVLLLIGIIITTIVLVTRTEPKRNYPPAILRWNPSGITVAGTGIRGTASNQLREPWDLIFDWSHALYVSDRYHHRIQKFPRESLYASTVAGQNNGSSGTSSAYFNQCSGIVLDSLGNLYVGDMNNHRIQFWSNGASSGVTITGNGTAGNSINQLNLPHSLDYDSTTDTLYVADLSNHRIMSYQRKNSSGTIVAGGTGSGTNSTQLFWPHAAFYDSSSNSLLIANTAANNVVRWVLGASNWTLVAGSQNGSLGTNSTLFNGPTDVMLDPMRNMYVMDRMNHRVQFFPEGESIGTTIVGTTGQSGNSSTTLNTASSITLDNQLNLYVGDQYNYRVQKFSRY